MSNQILKYDVARKALAEAKSIDDVKNIPESPGVYIIYQANRLLYIGQSVNLKKRLSNHHRKKHIEDRRTLIKIIICDNHKELETLLIRELNPRLNNKCVDEQYLRVKNIEKHRKSNEKLLVLSVDELFNHFFGEYI